MNCFSQEMSQNLKKDYDYGVNLDTINCSHFKIAHKIIKKEGMRKFSTIVDYPVLEYIADNKKCNNLKEHGIDENDLKYFIYSIILIEKEY